MSVLMSQNDMTGQSGPDLTQYYELKQQAIAQTNDARRVVAGRFVPRLYAELIKQHFSPLEAAAQIYEDFVPLWAYEYIQTFPPPETRDQSKVEGGKKSAARRREKSMLTVKYWIYGNHHTFGKINEAWKASSDSNFRIGVNSRHQFLVAEPITPKSTVAPVVTFCRVFGASSFNLRVQKPLTLFF